MSQPGTVPAQRASILRSASGAGTGFGGVGGPVTPPVLSQTETPGGKRRPLAGASRSPCPRAGPGVQELVILHTCANVALAHPRRTLSTPSLEAASW